MKANEFVKKFGWDEAKKVITKESNLISFCPINFYENLKHLVDSHKLVENVGGIEKAKMLLRMRIAAELYDSADEIEKAIADVESCL